jgi:WD40-like Beta Propeller Repeat
MRTSRIGCAAVALVAMLACTAAKAAPSNARVTVEAGNVFIVKDGARRQLTRTGRDFDAALSPDGRFVAFTRGDGKPPPDDPSECRTGAAADQLRRIDVDGRNERLLVTGHNGAKPPQQLCRFQEKQFSSDGRRLFFLSPGWTTSAALHVYDFDSKAVRFVAPANGAIVLNSCTGKHRDALILNQHRYFLGGGSYDWYWLFDPSATKEIGPVADDAAKREEVVEKAHDMICVQ